MFKGDTGNGDIYIHKTNMHTMNAASLPQDKQAKLTKFTKCMHHYTKMGWTTKLSGLINIYTLSLPGANKLLHANASLPDYKGVKYVTG